MNHHKKLILIIPWIFIVLTCSNDEQTETDGGLIGQYTYIPDQNFE